MSVNEFGGIGLALGVVTGVRSFRVDKLGRLTGIHYKQVWTPGENEAECRKEEVNNWGGISARMLNQYLISNTFSYETAAPTTRTVPSIPAQIGRRGKKNITTVQVPVVSRPVEPTQPVHDMTRCACGFYAYYDGSDDYNEDGFVSGVVEGFGETLIGTRGFRAMKSRIVALRISKKVPEQLAKLIARNYADIPQFTSFKQMVAAFPPDAGGMEVTPESDPDFWKRAI